MKPPPKPPPRPAPAAPGAAPGGTARPRILVVDDDPDIARLICRSLEKEYDMKVAPNGPAALAIAQAEPFPDLVLLDVMMPGMDGFAVARRIRALPNGKRTPILFLTARDTPLDRIQGIQSGARSYLTKPFKLDDLLGKVRSALGR